MSRIDDDDDRDRDDDDGGYRRRGSVPAGSSGVAVGAMVLGIIGLIAWCLPIIGGPLNLVGLILGIVAMQKPGPKGMATAGIIMSIIGLLLSIGNAAVGVYIALNGGFK